jgi:predicted DNA-binding transcriptional regulator AlpA
MTTLPDPAPERRYVDLKVFCAMFGLSKTRVYVLRKRGVLTRKRLGGRSRWSVAEGEAYMSSLPTDQRPPPRPPRGGKGRRRS